MQVKKTEIPEQSLLRGHLPADYSDAFAGVFSPERAITPDDMMIAFWTTPPVWVAGLMRLRNALVKPFGLKGAGASKFAEGFEKLIRDGQPLDMISVQGKTPDETAIALEDKHLVAYVSILLENAGAGRVRVYCGTVVRFNNRLGRVYFALIKPFHCLVVKSMLKRAVKKTSG